MLGHSDLAWGARPDDDGFRCGFFKCAEGAQPIVDVATAVERAESALGDAPDDKTAAADLIAATDRVAALELEIRDPDGRRLETTIIEIGDTLHAVSNVERSFDDTELIEELNEDFDLDDAFLERELFDEQLEGELANATLLDSFDDDGPAYSAADDPMRYVLSVKFVNPADCPARTWEE